MRLRPECLAVIGSVSLVTACGGAIDQFETTDASSSTSRITTIANGDAGASSDAQSALSSSPSSPPKSTSNACGAPLVPIDDGSGYTYERPFTCTASFSAPRTFASTTDATTALLGSWNACGGSSLFGYLSDNTGASGIEFTTGGRYFILGAIPGGDLVRLPNDASDGGTATQFGGSFSLTKMSPDAFNLTLSADNGAGISAVVSVSGTPPMLLVSTSGSDGDKFVPAETWKFRSGICGPALGTPATFDSADDVFALAKGKWIWCDGPDYVPFVNVGGIGFEIDDDYTFYALVEDQNGSIIRGPSGVVTIDATPPYGMNFMIADGEEEAVQAVISTCPSAMTFTWPMQGGATNQPLYLPIP